MTDFLSPRKGLMSRYGGAILRKDFYGVVNVMDLSDVLPGSVYIAFMCRDFGSSPFHVYRTVSRYDAIYAMLHWQNVAVGDVFSSMRVKRG